MLLTTSFLNHRIGDKIKGEWTTRPQSSLRQYSPSYGARTSPSAKPTKENILPLTERGRPRPHTFHNEYSFPGNTCYVLLNILCKKGFLGIILIKG